MAKLKATGSSSNERVTIRIPRARVSEMRKIAAREERPLHQIINRVVAAGLAAEVGK